MSTRNYGIEILRIIAMLMIVLLHVVGGSLQYAESGSNKYYILWFFEIMSYCAVNCFGIITGYIKEKNI